MDPDLERVIRQALADAKDAGKDYLTQTETAVRAVLQARPDMTASMVGEKRPAARRDRMVRSRLPIRARNCSY